MCSGCPRCGGFGYGHPVGCSLPRSLREEIRRSCGKVEDVEAVAKAIEDTLLERLGKDGVRALWVEDYHRRQAAEKAKQLPVLGPVVIGSALPLACASQGPPAAAEASFGGLWFTVDMSAAGAAVPPPGTIRVTT